MTSSITLKFKFLQIATNHVMVSLPPVGHIAGSFPVAASLSRQLEIEDDVDTKKFLNHSFASCLFDYLRTEEDVIISLVYVFPCPRGTTIYFRLCVHGWNDCNMLF